MLWHIFCICVWACPSPNRDLLDGKTHPAPLALGDWIRIWDEKYLKSLEVVHLSIFTIGSWQYWDMFAPNPSDTDWYGDAIIHYKDGSAKTVLYPRMFSLSIPQKFFQERYRKFYERAHNEAEYPYVFLPFAYREAYENYKDPNNPPVKVELRRNWYRVPEPGTTGPTGYNSYVYFTCEIETNQLRQMVGQKPLGGK